MREGIWHVFSLILTASSVEFTSMLYKVVSSTPKSTQYTHVVLISWCIYVTATYFTNEVPPLRYSLSNMNENASFLFSPYIIIQFLQILCTVYKNDLYDPNFQAAVMAERSKASLHGASDREFESCQTLFFFSIGQKISKYLKSMKYNRIDEI